MSNSVTAEHESSIKPARAWVLLGILVLGYIGLYLCRKNFAVANPLIREAFGLTKEQIGMVASYSTIAYISGNLRSARSLTGSGAEFPFCSRWWRWPFSARSVAWSVRCRC